MSTVIDLEKIELKSGAHASRVDGVCIMEAVAWLANEPHSDHPSCVCPVIGAFLRSWNDSVDDKFRQRLKPYIAKVIGTVDTHSEDRAWLAMDWIIREYLPTWLELVKITETAANLRSAPPIGPSSLANVTGMLAASKKEVYAAKDAALDAAGAAARAAAAAAAAAAAVKPPVKRLQENVFGLLDKMIAIGASERLAR